MNRERGLSEHLKLLRRMMKKDDSKQTNKQNFKDAGLSHWKEWKLSVRLHFTGEELKRRNLGLWLPFQTRDTVILPNTERVRFSMAPNAKGRQKYSSKKERTRGDTKPRAHEQTNLST